MSTTTSGVAKSTKNGIPLKAPESIFRSSLLDKSSESLHKGLLQDGLETPQFNSQETVSDDHHECKNSVKSHDHDAIEEKHSGHQVKERSSGDKGGASHSNSNISSYLELQHTQITEVGSEYEVTQNEGRASIQPGQRPPAQANRRQPTAKGTAQSEEYNQSKQHYTTNASAEGDTTNPAFSFGQSLRTKATCSEEELQLYSEQEDNTNLQKLQKYTTSHYMQEDYSDDEDVAMNSEDCCQNGNLEDIQPHQPYFDEDGQQESYQDQGQDSFEEDVCYEQPQYRLNQDQRGASGKGRFEESRQSFEDQQERRTQIPQDKRNMLVNHDSHQRGYDNDFRQGSAREKRNQTFDYPLPKTDESSQNILRNQSQGRLMDKELPNPKQVHQKSQEIPARNQQLQGSQQSPDNRLYQTQANQRPSQCQQQTQSRINQQAEPSTQELMSASSFSAPPTESVLAGLSISDLFEQLLKRTGLDEQRHQSRLRAAENDKKLTELYEAVLEHIAQIDERVKVYEAILQEDEILETQIFGPSFTNQEGTLCDIKDSGNFIKPEDLQSALNDFRGITQPTSSGQIERAWIPSNTDHPRNQSTLEQVDEGSYGMETEVQQERRDLNVQEEQEEFYSEHYQ